MMQGAPGFGRGMTVDFRDDVSVPSSQRASSRSLVSPPPNEKLRASWTSPDRSNMKVTAHLGQDFTHNEQGQIRSDAMEGPGSLFQEVQRRHMLQEFQKQFKQSEAAGRPPLNQFDSSPRHRQPSLPSMDGEKQWFINFDQQQQQQMKQQQPFVPLHVPPAAIAATPEQLQPKQQQSHVPAPAVSPQQQRSPQVQILKRSPRPTQPIQPPYQQGQHPLQQMLQQQQLSPPPQELQQQRQDQTRRPIQQQAFPSALTPPFLPQNVSPTLLDPISLLPIDTSKPPPPIGVPLPGLPFPPPGPPLVPFSPPNATTQPPLRQPSIPQLPPQPSVYPPQNTRPTPGFRHHPERSKATTHMGGDGSAFTAVPDSVWDNIPLGGGYTPLDSSVKTMSQAFLPRASDLLPQPAGQGGPGQMDQNQSKASIKHKRDGVQSQQKPWARKDKAKGRGMTKKDGQSAGVSPATKPVGAHSAPMPTKQPQETTQALSQEQAKNEYEWQSFKIVRKVRKVLGGLKDEQDAAAAAAEINNIMKAESGRLACFPWPKEQFVALDEILGWAMERPEIVEIVCKLIQELHGQHPENFAEDLTNTIMKRHTQYIKVSTATNKEKLYATFSGLVANMFVLSRSVASDFREIVDKLLDMTVNKWIMCDVQGTAEDPSMLSEVYACCLRALFIIIGPQLDEQKDQKYNKLLRDQVLGNQPRYVKEAMLDLLLLRAVGWKWSLEFKTESTLDSKRQTADDRDSRPETDESQNRVDGEKVPENSPQDSQTNIVDNQEGSNLVRGGGDASSTAPATDANVTAAKETPSQPVTSDVSRLDEGKMQSPSLASDVSVHVPPKNGSCLAQNASDRPDASAGDSQAEQASFNVDGGSTARFKLPDRETAERGAFVLNQTPFQVPYIPSSPVSNSFMASRQTTPHQFVPGVSTASLNSWSPVYLNHPRETKASNEEGSPSKPKLGLSLQTNASKRPETTQDSLLRTVNTAAIGPVGNFSTVPSPSRLMATTVGPAIQLSSQVGITGLAAAESAKQSSTPDTVPQTGGPTSKQLSANNSNCLGKCYHSDGQENDAEDHDTRLQSIKEQGLTEAADFLTRAEKGAISEATDEHQQPDQGQTGTGHRGLPRQKENFWEEESDSTSDLEQLPSASSGDYGPPKVFLPQQELSHQLEGARHGGGQVQLDTQRGQSQGPFYGRSEKGSPSLLAVAAGSPRCGSNVLGRGMMRMEQGGGRASPATGLLTSPLAFIQATTGPTRSAARKDGDTQMMEATVEQTNNSAEAKKSQAVGSLNQKLVSSVINNDPNSTLGQTKDMEARQGNEVGHDTKAPQTLSGDDNAPSLVTVKGLSPRPKGSNIQDTFQPTLDVATDYFGVKGSQNGQRIQDIFRQTAFRAPEFVPEEMDKALDEKGSPTPEGNPGNDDLGKEGCGAPNKGVMAATGPGVTTQRSLVERKEEQPLGTASRSTEPTKQSMACPLCGSNKHRTRQCDVFKMYAPRAKTSNMSNGEPEPEPEIREVQKPKTESKFGQTIFCSKCGQKGHLTYDCPVRGNFNIFK
ncbi:uncharacterized protein LOC119739888 [Patiria miniata]|uniref:CCHC-type domain-containing protein n=1 Tax=Patiria miniata TaxID=46514 RepID=A0A914B4F6_PATMI|nr:uncharacterized protein LOC119739888 [Patiria miniata]